MPNVSISAEHLSHPLGYVLGHHPLQIGSAAGGFVRSVYQSARLPLRVAKAAHYRTAQVNGCLACQDFPAGDHLDAYLESVGGDAATSVTARGGEKPDGAFYAAIAEWRTSSLFDARERLAIDYAERLANTPRNVAYDVDPWWGLHAAFSDAEVADLTLAVCCWMAMGRLIHALGLDTVCMADMLQPTS